MLDYCGIYKITNPASGKFYIGSSVNIRSRWLTHKNQLRRNQHENPHLQAAWNSNPEGLVFEIVIRCPKPCLAFWESHFIEEGQSWKREFGYNISRDTVRGNTPSVKGRIQIRNPITNKGRVVPKEVVQEWLDQGWVLGRGGKRPQPPSHTGKVWVTSPEGKGKRILQEDLEGFLNLGWEKGKPSPKEHSEEHNQKVSEALKGRKFTEAHRKSLSESHKKHKS